MYLRFVVQIIGLGVLVVGLGVLVPVRTGAGPTHAPRVAGGDLDGDLRWLRRVGAFRSSLGEREIREMEMR